MNNPFNTDLFDKAAAFAIAAHHGTERRGKALPYIIHPMEAASIVSTMTNDPELLAAAILHDVVEDTDTDIAEIRAQFGDRVADLVDKETAPAGKLPWREKRQRQAAQIRNANRDSKMVAMGDKLSNLRAIALDYEAMGDLLWTRFHAPDGKKDLAWYYRQLGWALFELSETAPYREFASLLDKVFGPLDLDHAEMLDMADYEESGGGYCSVSYNHRDGVTMIKLYDAEIGKQMPRQELELAHRVAMLGIPTPMAGRLVTDGKRYGAEFRRINPKLSFARHLSLHPDDYADIAHRFTVLCKNLHATECDPVFFQSVKTHSREMALRCPDLDEATRQRALQFIDSTPDPCSCLHGDLHIGNVITNGTADLWIDMGDFRWGHPLYDLGMFYSVAHCISEELTMELYHISHQLMLKVWNNFLSEYYGTDDPDELQRIEEQIAPYAAVRLICIGTEGKMVPAMLQFINSQFGTEKH